MVFWCSVEDQVKCMGTPSYKLACYPLALKRCFWKRKKKVIAPHLLHRLVLIKQFNWISFCAQLKLWSLSDLFVIRSLGTWFSFVHVSSGFNIMYSALDFVANLHYDMTMYKAIQEANWTLWYWNEMTQIYQAVGMNWRSCWRGTWIFMLSSYHIFMLTPDGN